MKDKEKNNKGIKESKELFKKFQFFDKIENEDEGDIECRVKYSLNEFLPIQMKTINKFIFMIGSPQNKGLRDENEMENVMIKVYRNKVLDEYKFFNKQFCFFEVYKVNPKITCLAAIGINENEDSSKHRVAMPVLKLYDFTNCFNKSACQGPALINVININSDKQIMISNMKSISCFAINENNTMASIGLSNGKVILIESKITLEDNSPRVIRYLSDDRIKEAVTNIQFKLVNGSQMLFVTTLKQIFYFKIEEKKEEGEIIPESGIVSSCFDYYSNKNFLAFSNDSGLSMYSNFKKVAQWTFEGSILYLSFFNDYIVFLSNRNMESILQIFDLNNRYFAHFENTFDKILLVSCDKENLYALFETDIGKEVRIYQEKDNKDKFETFYKKGFYDTAYTYAKNLNYDGKTLAEISNRHAKYLYKGLEYEKSIKEYIKTINYLDPSYVIQDFLDGSKLDNLIYYLEALHNNDRFKENCPHQEMKDYTALLLNCYIKQKQLDKLKDFLDKIDGNEKLIDIGTAIEVCKESDQADIALNIATKCGITESSIQILIELQEEYNSGLNSIVNEESIVKKYKLFLKYGEILLDKCPSETNKAICKLIGDIIVIRQSNNENAKLEIEEINYDTIIQIYHKKEKDFEKLLKFIMEKDINCPISIIHRQIEVYCKHKRTKELVNLLNKKEYIDRIDKNYILLLLSTNESNAEIVLLSEKMNLKHELFQLYIKYNEQQKIIDFCKATGKDDPSIWVQALAYYINQYSNVINQSNKHQIKEYIRTIIRQVLDNEIVSPSVLFEVLSKIKNFSISLIKDILNHHLSNLQKTYDENKKICDQNNKSIDKLQCEIKDLKQKSKLFNISKCTICNQQLYMPYIYFFCSHAFHPNCLNSELKDNNMKKECPVCAKSIYNKISYITYSNCSCFSETKAN